MASAPAPHNAYSMYRNAPNLAAPMAIGHLSNGRSPSSAYSVSPSAGTLSLGPASVKPRRTVSSNGVNGAGHAHAQLGGRRRSGTNTSKRPPGLAEDAASHAASLSSARGMSPATLTSQNLKRMTLSGAADDDGDEVMDDGEEAEGDSASTGSTPAPGMGGVRKSRSKKEKGQTFQCEKCSKVYRHPQCLIKHRWEHTQYWKEASKLMLSKHQSVQMLEAAAILFSPPQTLPVEKQFWPAAVSPPTSGLLGSDGLNIDTIRTTTGVSSSFGTSVSVSQPSSWARSTSLDSEIRDGRDDEDDDGDYGSPETDPNPDLEIEGDEAMFKIEDIDDDLVEHEMSKATLASRPSNGQRLASSLARNGAGGGVGAAKLALAVSAPVMGFFDDHQPAYNQYGQYSRGRR